MVARDEAWLLCFILDNMFLPVLFPFDTVVLNSEAAAVTAVFGCGVNVAAACNRDAGV